MQYVMVVEVRSNDDTFDDWGIDAACSYVNRHIQIPPNDIDISVSVRPLSEIIDC